MYSGKKKTTKKPVSFGDKPCYLMKQNQLFGFIGHCYIPREKGVFCYHTGGPAHKMALSLEKVIYIYWSSVSIQQWERTLRFLEQMTCSNDHDLQPSLLQRSMF